MSRPLLPSLRLIDGETHSSFASRLAARHQSSPRDFCSDLGMRWPSLCSGHADQLDLLAWLSGNDISDLSFWCPQKIGIGRYRVGKTRSSTGVFRRAQVRVCPRCTVDAFERNGPAGLFQLLEWSVCCLYRCELHGTELMALPLAKTSHETYDVVAQILRHLPSIQSAAGAAKDLCTTSFETYVRNRIWHGAASDWLQRMDLTQLHRACLTLGVMLSHMPQTDILRLPPQLQREACERGFKGLCSGPLGLWEHLDKLRTKTGASRPYAATDMGVFYAWLQSTHNNPAVVDIADSVRAYVFEKYPITNTRDILGHPVEFVSCITFDEARKRTGLSGSFIKRLLCHLEGLPFDKAQTVTEIDVSDLRRVQEFWNKLCNLEEASGMLALKPTQVKALIKLGVFHAIQFGSALRYLRRSEIESCLADLDQLPPIGGDAGFMPLKDFCRLKGVPISKILAAWHWGRLNSFLRRTEGSGLHQIAVSSDAVFDKLAIELTRDLSLRETASYLRISVISIRKLRDEGLLQQIKKRNPNTNHQRSYISFDSILHFEKRFATLGQLSEQFDIAPIHLARQFDRDGISPAISACGDIRVYERDQFQNTAAGEA